MLSDIQKAKQYITSLTREIAEKYFPGNMVIVKFKHTIGKGGIDNTAIGQMRSGNKPAGKGVIQVWYSERFVEANKYNMKSKEIYNFVVHEVFHKPYVDDAIDWKAMDRNVSKGTVYDSDTLKNKYDVRYRKGTIYPRNPHVYGGYRNLVKSATGSILPALPTTPVSTSTFDAYYGSKDKLVPPAIADLELRTCEKCGGMRLDLQSEPSSCPLCERYPYRARKLTRSEAYDANRIVETCFSKGEFASYKGCIRCRPMTKSVEQCTSDKLRKRFRSIGHGIIRDDEERISGTQKARTIKRRIPRKKRRFVVNPTSILDRATNITGIKRLRFLRKR
jgi:hypothetical protein